MKEVCETQLIDEVCCEDKYVDVCHQKLTECCEEVHVDVVNEYICPKQVHRYVPVEHQKVEVCCRDEIIEVVHDFVEVIDDRVPVSVVDELIHVEEVGIDKPIECLHVCPRIVVKDKPVDEYDHRIH